MKWLYDKLFNIDFKTAMRLKRKCFYASIISLGIFLLFYYVASFTVGIISTIFTIICIICVIAAIVLYLYSISPS